MKTREQWAAEAVIADRFRCYMKGWYAGAGHTGIDPTFADHPTLGEEYKRGYLDGKHAGMKASEAACKRLGYKQSVLRTMKLAKGRAMLGDSDG